LHLDRNLYGAKMDPSSRHLLPIREVLATKIVAFGVGPGTQLLA